MSKDKIEINASELDKLVDSFIMNALSYDNQDDYVVCMDCNSGAVRTSDYGEFVHSADCAYHIALKLSKELHE